VKNLLNPNHRIRFHVRRFEVGPYVTHNLPRHFDTGTVVQILYSLTNLQDFGWNVRSKMPDEILQTLHKKWPHCRIHVNQQARGATLNQRSAELDTELLSSPQLVSLELELWESVWNRKPLPLSEWTFLTELLIRNKSLKVFRLCSRNAHNFESGSPEVSQLHLEPPADAKFPSLEDFGIPIGFQADQIQVSLLLPAMPWSSLRRLDVGHGPGFLLQAITGLVPQLKSLSVALVDGSDMTRLTNQETLIAFIRSISSLEEVSVVDFDAELSQSVWLAILHSHGKTLRIANRYGKISDSEAEVMVTKAPHLEQLWILINSVPDFMTDSAAFYPWVSTSL
jgi:hypothetical protein